ncbi:MAG: hypothetical protein K0R54_1809 [Clostridiaceae bacterium]|jgi:hypothetical protein|nr:hypothetical protein [Clostridiaceae bacterium]
MISKVTFKTASLFSLKNYNDSHLNSRSYEYPMTYTLRGAILSSVIQLDGVEKAKELFHKIKNAIIYVQYPGEFVKNTVKLKLASNSYYGKQKEDEELEVGENITSVGVREFVDVDKIVFYIDNSISNLEMYLNNIEVIGNSDSMVYLESIEKVDKLENVLMPWVEEVDGDCYLYEMYDWVSSKIKFEDIYLFSEKRNRKQEKRICCVKNIKI